MPQINYSQNDIKGGQNNGREPVFNIPVVILVLTALCALIYFAEYYILSAEQDMHFMLNFAFIPARFTYADGFFDPAALFTLTSYSLMHGSFAHLAVNMVWLIAFGSPLAGRLGVGRFIGFWVVTAIASALTHYAIYPASTTPLVGASGAISGMMGAAARYGFRRVSPYGENRHLTAFAGPILPIRVTLTYKPVLTFVGFWFIINIATGLYTGTSMGMAGIAWEAHIGGFLAGFFGIVFFDKRKTYDFA